MGGQRKAYAANKLNGGMKISVRICLRREDCGSCGRRVVAKINIWLQKAKHDMPSTQLKEMRKRRNLLVLKTLKKRSFMSHTQIRTVNQDVIGGKCIRSDDGHLSLDDASKKLAWEPHYERLLNIGFQWSQNLPHVDPAAGPVQFLTPDDILKSLRRTKNGKAARPSGVVAEILKASPDICCKIIADLMNAFLIE